MFLFFFNFNEPAEIFLPTFEATRRGNYMSSHFEDEMNAFFKFSVVSVFLVPNYRPVGLLNSG